MQTTFKYLQCRGIVHTEPDFRSELMRLWFTPYPRHPGGQADSSGFEHVMVGEYQSSSEVNGLHSWLAYYLKEKNHQINYYGYVERTSPNLVALNYSWNGRHKGLGSFFLGTSPEFDMALYTLCALANTGAVQLNGKYIHIQTHDISFVSGHQIASAYPSF
nr:hypothetical protein BaRGS_018247 [Batillaria attramentaria]